MPVLLSVALVTLACHPKRVPTPTWETPEGARTGYGERVKLPDTDLTLELKVRKQSGSVIVLFGAPDKFRVDLISPFGVSVATTVMRSPSGLLETWIPSKDEVWVSPFSEFLTATLGLTEIRAPRELLNKLLGVYSLPALSAASTIESASGWWLSSESGAQLLLSRSGWIEVAEWRRSATPIRVEYRDYRHLFDESLLHPTVIEIRSGSETHVVEIQSIDGAPLEEQLFNVEFPSDLPRRDGVPSLF